MKLKNWMMALVVVLGVCAVPAFAAHSQKPVAADSQPAIENSMVKIFSTMRYPDPFKPWAKSAPAEATASGVVIEGRRILTNAHAVLYAAQVQVQANAAGDKLSAQVVAIAPGIDLAVLKLDDAAFFDQHPPLARASKLPQIKDAVLAYGYPTGGSSLSITKGIVSRIEYVSYNFPVSGLRIQIDAAINPGNSGGPAIADNKMIGLAFSGLRGDTQNIGYIIPNEEVEMFLKDIADGHYDGKLNMYDELQTLENPALRQFLKLDRNVQGMIVHRPDKTDASYPLKEWDVISKVGDTPIDNQGMIKINRDLRVQFGYEIEHVAKDGKLPLTIVRDGKTQQIQLPVSTDHPTLVPDLMGDYPRYFIYGPLCFSVGTRQMLQHLDSNPATMRALTYLKNPLLSLAFDPPTPELEELVVVSSPFFPHPLSIGYSNAIGSVVYSINGTPIRSLKHLVEFLRDSKDEFITIEFAQKGGEALVFQRAALASATEEILKDNDVRAQASPELLSVWQHK